MEKHVMLTPLVIEVTGTARNLHYMNSRRWRHGEKSLRAASDTAWRRAT